MKINMVIITRMNKEIIQAFVFGLLFSWALKKFCLEDSCVVVKRTSPNSDDITGKVYKLNDQCITFTKTETSCPAQNTQK